MRILLIGDYPPDPRLGSAKVPIKLQEEFRALGHDCDLLLSDAIGGPRTGYLRQAVAPVLAYRAARRVARDRGAYDVVDAASAEGLWIARSRRSGVFRRSAVIARSNGLEHLNYQRMLDDHDAGLLRKPWTRRWFYPLTRLTQVAAAARAADRLLLLNEVDRAFAIGRGWKPAEQIDVVPHGVSSAFLDAAPPSGAPRGRGILFCGTWTDMKGVTYLADAFSGMAARGVDARLTVLGGGVPEGVILAAFAPAARPRVTVIDRLPESDVMAAYRTHDVLVLPSSYEGFGMVVIEAMSQRLPVVATPTGCARTLVRDGVTGLLVPVRDAAALAVALERVLNDAGLRQRVADAAYAQVRDMTWKATAARTVEVYRRAMAARGEAA